MEITPLDFVNSLEQVNPYWLERSIEEKQNQIQEWIDAGFRATGEKSKFFQSVLELIPIKYGVVVGRKNLKCFPH